MDTEPIRDGSGVKLDLIADAEGLNLPALRPFPQRHVVDA